MIFKTENPLPQIIQNERKFVLSLFPFFFIFAFSKFYNPVFNTITYFIVINLLVLVFTFFSYNNAKLFFYKYNLLNKKYVQNLSDINKFTPALIYWFIIWPLLFSINFIFPQILRFTLKSILPLSIYSDSVQIQLIIESYFPYFSFIYFCIAFKTLLIKNYELTSDKNIPTQELKEISLGFKISLALLLALAISAPLSYIKIDNNFEVPPFQRTRL